MSENNNNSERNSVEKDAGELVAVQRVRPFFNKLLVLFLMGLVIWNWDGLWQIPQITSFLSKHFPHQAEKMAQRRETWTENSTFVRDIKTQRDNAKQEAAKIQAGTDEMRAKQDEICAYLREAAAMFRQETSTVKGAVHVEGFKGSPLKCNGANPKICQQIKRDSGKVDELCPEVG